MRILAIYGTRYGQAEAVLTRVARGLASAGHEVTIMRGDRSPGSRGVRQYGAVVVAASVIRGRYQAYIRKFVIGHRDVIQARFSAFLSVSGAAPESDAAWRTGAQRHVDDFLADTGWRPDVTRIVAGALRYRRYHFVLRLVMKRISAAHGGPTDTSRDHEFTDWDGLDRFATELGTRLREMPPRGHREGPTPVPAS